MPEAYEPGLVFDAFLLELKKRGITEWKRYDRKLHQAFWSVQPEYKDEMGDFKYLVRTSPYCQTLDILHWEYMQAGKIAPQMLGGQFVVTDLSKLRQPDKRLQQITKSLCDKFEELNKPKENQPI